MGILKVTAQSLEDIADAIRQKANIATPLTFPSDYIGTIENLEPGDEGNWQQHLARYIGGSVCNIPDTLEVLRDYAFYAYPGFTTDMLDALPHGLKKIGSYAFGNLAITDMDLSGRSLIELAEFAFGECTGITRLDLSDNDLQTIGQYAAARLSNATLIDLSGNIHLTYIPPYFAYRTNGSGGANCSVDVTGCPIEEIDDYAFSSAHYYQHFAFPISSSSVLKRIGKYAFANNEVMATWSLDLSGCTALEDIDDYAFSNSGGGQMTRGVTILTLPASLKTLGAHSFGGNFVRILDASRCTLLEEIGNYAFDKHQAMDSLDLSACIALKKIGEAAFYNSTIGTLTLPSQILDAIGKNAFRGNKLLQTPTLTVSSKVIEERAFDGCTGPTKVEIFGCTNYGINVFNGCTGLTQAHIHTFPTTFPSNITTYPVFNGCTNLTDIYVPWGPGGVQENRFVKSSQSVTWHYNYTWE